MKYTRTLVAAALGLSLSAPVLAQDGFEFDPDNMYAGGGISNNSVSAVSDNATGFQIFAGYNAGEIFGVEKLDLIIEAGYMDSGDFGSYCAQFDPFTGNCIQRRSVSASGVWTTGGVAYRFNPDWSFFGRAGLDLGDDDGFMIGGGAAYHLNDVLELRGELVERDTISSIQFNVAYDF